MGWLCCSRDGWPVYTRYALLCLVKGGSGAPSYAKADLARHEGPPTETCIDHVHV